MHTNKEGILTGKVTLRRAHGCRGMATEVPISSCDDRYSVTRCSREDTMGQEARSMKVPHSALPLSLLYMHTNKEDILAGKVTLRRAHGREKNRWKWFAPSRIVGSCESSNLRIFALP